MAVPVNTRMIAAIILVLFFGISKPLSHSAMPQSVSPAASSLARKNLPVFPGAVGFGTTTIAGRGGQIIKVTNLNASGPGSLKAALDTAGPRFIVFEVGGTIDWTDLGPHVTITEPFATIAGQTAPVPGINIKGSGIRIATHDVLIQHLRVRVGNVGYKGIRDGIMVLGKAERVVIDHVSIAWATNEGFVTWESPKNITLSNSIITENTMGEKHGILLGDLSKEISLIGNLISQNTDRNPLVKGGTSVLLANNVIYNPGTGNPCVMTDDYDHGPSKLSLIGNIYLQGPQTKTVSGPSLIDANKKVKPGTQIYQSDNVYLDRNGASLPLFSRDAIKYQVTTSPLFLNGKTFQPSKNVLAQVVTHAGARPVERDIIDQRAIEHLLSKTGLPPHGQAEVFDYTSPVKTRRPLNLPKNPHGDDNGNGYTNIEEMLQRLAAEIEGRH